LCFDVGTTVPADILVLGTPGIVDTLPAVVVDT